MDRRETGLFPGKKVTSLSGSLKNVFFAFSRSKSVSQLFALCHSVDRFVSKRSSSSLNVAAPALDVRAATRRSHRPGEAIDRPLTHEEPHIETPRAAVALVEDEPCGSVSKRRKIHVYAIVRDWFLDMLNQWRTERLGEVQRLWEHIMG